MEREKLSLATTIMAMDMDMVDMVIMATMERGKPKQLLLLSQDTITMDTVIMEDMDTRILSSWLWTWLWIWWIWTPRILWKERSSGWLPSWIWTWLWIWWIWSSWILWKERS